MKKIIYYVAVSIFALTLLVVSLAQGSSHPDQSSIFGDEIIENAQKNVKALTESDEAFDFVWGEVSKITGTGNITVSALVSEQHYTYTDQVRYFGDTSTIFAPKLVKNILVTVKKTTGGEQDVMMISTHFNPAFGSQSAASAINTALMIEAIKLLAVGEQSFNSANEIAFLFTDAHFEGNIGLRKFFDTLDSTLKNPLDGGKSFSQEKSILQRTKLAISLQNFGTEGRVALYGTSEANFNLVDVYHKGGGKAHSWGSAFSAMYAIQPNSLDAFQLWNKSIGQVLAFGSFEGKQNFDTIHDTYENLDKGLLVDVSNNLFSVIDTFGTISLSIETKGRAPDAIYFGYLGLGNIVLSFAGIVVLLCLTLLLLGFAVVLNRRRENKYDFYKILLASAVNLLIVAAAFAVVFFFKTILGLFGSFGAIIRSPFYTSPMLLTGFLICTIAALMVARYIFGRFFQNKIKIEERDFALSTGLIFVLLSLVFVIFIPSASYLFVFVALIFALNLFVKNIVKKQSLDNLNLDLVGLALAVPLFISFAFSMYALWGATALTEMVPLFGLLFLFVLPATAKINVDTPVMVKSKKAEEKKPLKFTNLIAGCLAAVVGLVFILSGGLDSGVRNNFGVSITKTQQGAFDAALYKNSVVYNHGQELEVAADRTLVKDTSFTFAVSGEDISRSIKKYTDLFDISRGGLSTASAQKISLAKNPEIELGANITYIENTEKEDEVEDDEYIFTGIIYTMKIKPAQNGNKFEISIPAEGLSIVTIMTDENSPILQFDKNLFEGQDSIKIYYDKPCTISLFFNDLEEFNSENLPALTVGYREAWIGVENIPSALDFIKKIEGLGFNVLFQYSIILKPHKIIATE